MEKILKARKEHICQLCDGKINKEEIYVLHELKGPVYEDSEDPEFVGKQISVWFYKEKQHLPELHCHWPEECKKGNHVKLEYHDSDPNSNTCGQYFSYCEECGTDLSDIE